MFTMTDMIRLICKSSW